MNQLHSAHLEAERVGLQGGGLSTANGLQQAAAEKHKQYQAGLREELRARDTAGRKQAVFALEQAGFRVELGAAVWGDGFVVDLLVWYESCSSAVAVDIVSEGAFFRHPRGQLSGKVAALHAQVRHRCKLVVLSEGEARQADAVVGAVQRELARP